MSSSPAYTLVLLRHGQSEWNEKNLFTGWVDVGLTETGREEARRGGELLTERGLLPDVLHTSVMRRAIETATIALDAADRMWLPVRRSWRLNERHYGALQGRNKDQLRREIGEEQVQTLRRDYTTRPPALDELDERYPGREPKYGMIPRAQLPLGESLKDTVARVLPYWRECVEPLLVEGRTPIIVAHGTSLRGLVKYIDNVSDADIERLEIPTGRPLIYELDQGLTPVRSFYLEDRRNSS